MSRLDAIKARIDAATGDYSFDNEQTGAPGDDPVGVFRVAGKTVAVIHDDVTFTDGDQEFFEHAIEDAQWLESRVRNPVSKCLDCARPVFTKLVDDTLMVSPCSNCIAKAEREAARAANDWAREDAARDRDERGRW